MSDEQPTLAHLDAEERKDQIRNRVLLGVVGAIAIAVALWVGGLIDNEQKTTAKAEKKTEQAQVEKFNLAQQVAAACADPDAKVLDDVLYARLCTDARTIVREGPQGAQGIPGVQGPMGPQGVTGAQGARGPAGSAGAAGTDGKAGPAGPAGAEGAVGPAGPAGADGAPGPQGPPGADGKDGAVGPAGPAGANGEPPMSWVVYGSNGQVTERCERATNFDPTEPRYTCTRENGPLP
jgi:hypothetical protein